MTVNILWGHCASDWTKFDDLNTLWGHCVSDWTAFDDLNALWRHCVSDWTAFDDCEHFMGGIVCPTGLRFVTVSCQRRRQCDH